MLQKIVEVKTNIGIDTIVVDFDGKTASLTDLTHSPSGSISLPAFRSLKIKLAKKPERVD
jgi:hypothetical protein